MIIPHWLLGKNSYSYLQNLEKSVQNGVHHVFPLNLVVSVTNQCTSYCPYCPVLNKQIYSEKKFISTSAVLSCAEEFYKLGGRYIRFTGGEPLLHPKIVQMLEKVSKMGLLATIGTNGLLLLESDLNFVQYLKAITVSIDTLDSQLCKELRGISIDQYDKIIDAMCKIKYKYPGIWVGVNCVVSQKNIESIPGLVSHLASKKIPIQFMPCHSFKNENLAMYPTAEAAVRFISTIEALQNTPGIQITNSIEYIKKMPAFWNGEIMVDQCPAIYHQAFMDTNAQMRLCCQMEPVGEFRKIGDMKKLWDSPIAKRQRSLVDKGKCPQCWLNFFDAGIK